MDRGGGFRRTLPLTTLKAAEMALAFNKVASTPAVARSRVNVVCQAHKGT